MSCPPAIMAQLKMHREAAAQSAFHQGWIADWWARILPDDRRTLLALSGLDDSIEFARRPWQQMTAAQREKLVFECKKVARLVGGIQWA